MGRRHWKQPYTVALDKDVASILKEAEKLSGYSRSAIVQTAILFWHSEKWAEWQKTFAAQNRRTK